VQDLVFLQEGQCDPGYAARRAGALLIAVECTQAAATCFCASMGTGPECGPGFDLALTEIDHGFVVRIGTPRGRDLIEPLNLQLAGNDEADSAAAGRARAREQMGRTLATAGLREGLLAQLRSPRWDEIAQRCLSCANCTAVCPTCFCSSVVDVPSLDPDIIERERRWDSCFQHDFSWQGGGVIRQTIGHRYRQWLTHKLATWHDQFGVSGCVGCGRCITWCPVGIDLTVEVPALLGTAVTAGDSA
jgi:ferredoxin